MAYQQGPPPHCKPSYAPDDCYNPYPWPKYVAITHVWGDQQDDCLPFATNFTTLELLFAPDYRLGKVLPLLDLQVHRFDNKGSRDAKALCAVTPAYVASPGAPYAASLPWVRPARWHRSPLRIQRPGRLP